MGLTRPFDALRGSGLKTRLLHPVDEVWDAWLGVRTSGFDTAVGSDCVHYEPTPYAVIRKTLAQLELGAGDVLVDIGCGLARPLLYAAGRFPLTRAVGVELNPALVEMASANVTRMRKTRCPVEIEHAPAQEYGYTDATAFFMYHPFWAETMRAVLDRIHTSLEAHPRDLRFAYLNPLAQDEFARCSWLEQTDEWEHARVRSLNIAQDASVAVTFWRSR